MYDVDFILGILVSWMSIMCGLVCSFCVNSWIPSRLELMHPVFLVIIFRVWVWGFCELAELWGIS